MVNNNLNNLLGTSTTVKNSLSVAIGTWGRVGFTDLVVPTGYKVISQTIKSSNYSVAPIIATSSDTTVYVIYYGYDSVTFNLTLERTFAKIP